MTFFTNKASMTAAAFGALAATFATSALAEVVTYEQGGDDYIFAGLTGDGTSFSGSMALATPYGSAYRAGVEVNLDSIRHGSSVEKATLRFYLDDVVYGTSETPGWTTLVPSFSLEAYTDTADGQFNYHQDSEYGVTDIYDFQGGAVARLNFEADANIEKPALDTGWLNGEYGETLGAGATYTGTLGGTTVYYADGMTDQDLDSRGFLGFEIDVTELVAAAAADSNEDWLGFRLFATSTEGWTSVDRSGFLPSLEVTVVPEPAALGLLVPGALLTLSRRRKA